MNNLEISREVRQINSLYLPNCKYMYVDLVQCPKTLHHNAILEIRFVFENANGNFYEDVSISVDEIKHINFTEKTLNKIIEAFGSTINGRIEELNNNIKALNEHKESFKNRILGEQL